MPVYQETKVDIGTVREYVEDIDFPTSKEEIIAMAEMSGATVDTLATLRELPDMPYRAAEDLDMALMELY